MRERVPRRNPRRPGLSDGLRRHLLTGDSYFEVGADASAVWREHGAALLRGWIAEHPGSRPWAWWKFTAPEPRRRLGGIGTPAHEVLAYVAEFHFGIPVYWVEPWMPTYYTGRARDVNGCPIGQEFRGRQFEGRPIDRGNQPMFESQAAYLRRLGLLTPGERSALSEEDFAPEAVTTRPAPIDDEKEGE